MSDMSDYSYSDEEAADIIETDFVDKLFPIYRQELQSKFGRRVTVCMMGDVIANQVSLSYLTVVENLKCLGQFLSKCADDNHAPGMSYDVKQSLGLWMENVAVENDKCVALLQKLDSR